MRSRRDKSNPLYRDVLQGSGGVTKGQFLRGNDGTEKPSDGLLLVSESGGFILQTGDGAGIWISRHGSE